MTVELDYLVVGHITRDLTDGAFTIGGTASYASRTARALGCRVGVLTSADPALDLQKHLGAVHVHRVRAQETTTFKNVYLPHGRRQVLQAVAERLTPEVVPPAWQPAIVHLGPVAGECAPSLAGSFADAFVGLTPQGWLRCWNDRGEIEQAAWPEAPALLPQADAVVLSVEDVGGDRELVATYAAQTACLVITQGPQGCIVYAEGERRHVPAPTVRELDPTGAGDIFAAAFFVWLHRTGDVGRAARLANCVASGSVTRVGLAGTPTPEDIERCIDGLR